MTWKQNLFFSPRWNGFFSLWSNMIIVSKKATAMQMYGTWMQIMMDLVVLMPSQVVIQ